VTGISRGLPYALRIATVEQVRRALALVLLGVTLLLGACGGDGHEAATPPTATEPPAEPEPVPQPPPAPPVPPSPVPPPTVRMSWSSAGAFVWHETDVSPEALGKELRAAGFGWVALRIHDGVTQDPVAADWVLRFRRASGLPVGGWGVLRERPAEEAALADELLARHSLDFYIADAEAEYGYTGPDGQSGDRFGRSRAFVEAFRRLRADLPAGLSSYCRPDHHDLDWGAWRAGGFVFLPQAYVNDFGGDAAPAVCAQAARSVFGSDVHPTIGTYPGVTSTVRPERYARLLARAGTVGFSVYLAETGMTGGEWRVLGNSIGVGGIALVPVP